MYKGFRIKREYFKKTGKILWSVITLNGSFGIPQVVHYAESKALAKMYVDRMEAKS